MMKPAIKKKKRIGSCIEIAYIFVCIVSFGKKPAIFISRRTKKISVLSFVRILSKNIPATIQ